mmetsp:Transcript_3748/g.10301  ORF Transcript_3748/g.10301 Transcript_3748/m.10301 type:complete len:210 (+) Transcript_3748:435-1064(+)
MPRGRLCRLVAQRPPRRPLRLQRRYDRGPLRPGAPGAPRLSGRRRRHRAPLRLRRGDRGRRARGLRAPMRGPQAPRLLRRRRRGGGHVVVQLHGRARGARRRGPRPRRQDVRPGGRRRAAGRRVRRPASGRVSSVSSYRRYSEGRARPGRRQQPAPCMIGPARQPRRRRREARLRHRRRRRQPFFKCARAPVGGRISERPSRPPSRSQG